MEDKELIDNLKKLIKSIDNVLLCIKNDESIIVQMRGIIEKTTNPVEIFAYETKIRIHVKQIDDLRKELREFNISIQNITNNYNAYKFMECYTCEGDIVYDFNGCNIHIENKPISLLNRFLSYF